MTCVTTIPPSPEFQWLSQQQSSKLKTNTISTTSQKGVDLARFTIQELIQQEYCIGSADYPVDRPSRLVQIECRKPGCRCVLKNEFALALKIIPGVTLVQGEWISPSSLIHDKERFNSTSSGNLNKSVHNLHSYPTPRPAATANGDLDSSPSNHVVLTSCCPSWFELVHRSVSGPKDSGPYFCPDVPVWSTGKAIWHAKPQFILLRKDVCCMIATKSQPFVTSSTDLSKKEDRSFLTLDADNLGQLRAGTVLRLLDCRLCRLTHKDGLDSLNSNRLMARHRSKTVSMLQFAVVGDKALAAVASSVNTIQPHDALRWFADGPRLVYLPLDSKSILASPVNFPVQSNQSNSTESRRSSQQGVHSLLSLLSSYQIPLVTRPIIGLRPNEWFFVGRFPNNDQSNGLNKFEPVSSAQQPLLRLFACHHGDLIFLEPLSECAGPICYSTTNRTSAATSQVMNSRFFVVTPDMLANHYFLVADDETCQSHARELETHALRVSHFLAACHPVQGLGYLLKHLEDTTHSSNIGPSHLALTRTLGPISNQMSTAAFQAALVSVAAVAALASGKYENLPMDHLNEIQPNVLNSMIMCTSTTDVSDMYQSATCLGGNMNHFTRSSISSSLLASEADEMNALCDEIEDIYFYVRNGHFPAHSRSMSSLPHQHLDSQNSAPISPKVIESSHVNRPSSKRRQQSTGQVLETSMKITDNRAFNYASKVTSKAPVVMIRANPMEHPITRSKVSINSPLHNGSKLTSVPIQPGPTYDSGLRFVPDHQQVTLSPRQPICRNLLNSTQPNYNQESNESHKPTLVTNSRPSDNFSPSRIKTSPYVSATPRGRPAPVATTPRPEASPFLVIPSTMVHSSGHFTLVAKPAALQCPNSSAQGRLKPYSEVRPDSALQAPVIMATSVNLMLNRPNPASNTVRPCDTGNYYMSGQDLDLMQNHYVGLPLNCESNGLGSKRQLNLSTSQLYPIHLTNGNQLSKPMTLSANPSMSHTPQMSRSGPLYQPELANEFSSKGLSSFHRLGYYAPDTSSQISSQYSNVQQPNLVKWVTSSPSTNNVPPSMPLLHQSRLCQSTTATTTTPLLQQDLADLKLVQTCPRPDFEHQQQQNGAAGHHNHQHHHYPHQHAAPKHPNQSPNSSPDTGIGGDSACDQTGPSRPIASRINPIWLTDPPYSNSTSTNNNSFVFNPVHANGSCKKQQQYHQVYQF